MQRLHDEQRVHAVPAQERHQGGQFAQFVAARQRLRQVGRLAACGNGPQVLVEKIVAHRVGVVGHQGLFRALGLVGQGVPVHYAGGGGRSRALRLGGGRGVGGRPQVDQTLAEDIGLLGHHRPRDAGIALGFEPAQHLGPALGLAEQPGQQGIGVFLEFVRPQPAIPVEPARREHDDDAGGRRQVVGQRRQHQLHAQGLEAGMAVGQHRHLQFVGQIAVGDEAQVVAGQLRRAQDDQAVARAQGLAQARQVAGLLLQRIAQVGEVDARRGGRHGLRLQGQRMHGAPSGGRGGGQGQRRRQRVLPESAFDHAGKPGKGAGRLDSGSDCERMLASGHCRNKREKAGPWTIRFFATGPDPANGVGGRYFPWERMR
ncbi:hypothetical protein D9M68_587140 [compost metagenome]